MALIQQFKCQPSRDWASTAFDLASDPGVEFFPPQKILKPIFRY